MEVELHNLLSAGWRPRKASGIIRVESKGLKTGIPRVEEDGCPGSSNQAERGEFLLLRFVLFRRTVYTTESIDWNAKLIWKHPFTDSPQNKV